ncbi:protein of unknown function [Stenotrophomonas maltophilia]|nr:protein of unknown function [Stenotrophomonas maltophilia]
MLFQLVAVVGSDLALQLLDLVALELDDLAAVHVDHVVMVAATVQLVDGLAAFEIVLEHETGGLELGQHPVDRRQADLVAMLKQLAVDIFGGHVVLGIALFKQRQDPHPWMGHLQADFSQVVGFHRSPFIGDLAPAASDWVAVARRECIIGLISPTASPDAQSPVGRRRRPVHHRVRHHLQATHLSGQPDPGRCRGQAAGRAEQAAGHCAAGHPVHSGPVPRPALGLHLQPAREPPGPHRGEELHRVLRQ